MKRRTMKDDEDDGIERMTLCGSDRSSVSETLSRCQMTSLSVKPRPPRVWNITFSPELHHATIQIQSPYQNDYLRVDNQLFQLHIWTTGHHDDKVHIT
ncbi:hypothetical protein INR49_005885 [Caranx melampygus]|nr:hypothetical protein INR49_005885 [Caranx melampygus]